MVEAEPPRAIIKDARRLGPDLGERLEHEIDPFGGKAFTLHAGKDFDVVVLAVPPDVQREICKSVHRASPDYARMLDSTRTVATQSSQCGSTSRRRISATSASSTRS